MQPEVQTPCVIAGPASDVSSMTTPPSGADDIATEIESPARAVNPYTRAKLVGLCGAEQSRAGTHTRSAAAPALSRPRRYGRALRQCPRAESRICTGATSSVAMGGGVLVSLST